MGAVDTNGEHPRWISMKRSSPTSGLGRFTDNTGLHLRVCRLGLQSCSQSFNEAVPAYGKRRTASLWTSALNVDDASNSLKKTCSTSKVVNGLSPSSNFSRISSNFSPSMGAMGGAPSRVAFRRASAVNGAVVTMISLFGTAGHCATEIARVRRQHSFRVPLALEEDFERDDFGSGVKAAFITMEK